jgi:FkbM family methyltransferase
LNLELARAEALLNQSKPNPDKAIKTLNRLMRKNSSSWLTYHYMGVAQLQKGEWEKAIKYLKKAIQKGSDEAETYHLLSFGYFQQGYSGPAVDFAKQALERNDKLLDAWLNLGSIYRSEARLTEALDCYKKANQLDPKNAGVAFRIAALYKDQGDLNKALELFNIAIQLDENFIDAYIEKGVILQKHRKLEEAKEAFETVLTKNNHHLGAYVGLAEISKSEGDYEEAIERYKEIAQRFPKVPGVFVNYALTLQEIGRFDESEAAYLKAVKTQPDLVEAFSGYLMGLHYNPENTKERIFEEHLKWDDLFAYKNVEERSKPANLDKNKKLRIGFISGGFRAHPVGWMVTKAIENLPKDQFEVYCYTTNMIVDDLTKRISKNAMVWRSLLGYSDEVSANVLRNDKLDILVELSGHSEDNRLKMVTLNPAPIVVKWVGGLFNTTGLEAVDYLITDHIESPEGDEEFYTEKLVRLPDDYICFLPPDYCPEVGELPAKENGFITFGCFNNPTKVNKEVMKQWAEILKEIPESRLFLKSKQYVSEMYTARLADQFEEWGVDRSRLMFEGESSHDALLNSYNKVDIALDPWPYSGGLTTCEALWMGVPVVTLPGPTFAGRHAATHLINAGLSEYVAESWDEYKEKVIGLASDTEALAKLRSGLREWVGRSPLCNGPGFAAHLSEAFKKMWEQRVDGYNNDLAENEWQDHINIERIEGDFKRQTTSKNLLVEVNGVRVSVPENLNALTPFVLLEQGQWYDPEVSLLKDILGSGDTLVDVGAGFGAYALEAANLVGKDGKVFAFEPGSVPFKNLELSKEENGFDQLHLFGKAVGATKGKVKFTRSDIPAIDKVDKNGEAEVEQTTLDAWWDTEGNPELDVLKIDVNGAEASVLYGAETLLEVVKPVVLLSVVDSAESFDDAKVLLENAGYKLFDYIPGTGVLSAHQGEFDPYQSNVVALTEVHESQLFEKGLIFDAQTEPELPAQGTWKNYADQFEWTENLIPVWEENSASEQFLNYYEAVDYLFEALRLDSKTLTEGSRTKRTKLILAAATRLIELYNQGLNSTSLAFTLSRALILLGKRGQAVEVIKTLLESTNLGKENIDVSLPFVFPLEIQDDTSINTDQSKWLMVRTIESWLLLNDISSFTSQQQELKLTELLFGNTEVRPEINQRYGLLALREGKDLDMKQKEIIAKSFVGTENLDIISDLLGVEVTIEEEIGGNGKKIFESSFWKDELNPKKAEMICEFLDRFETEGFETEILTQIVEETALRLKKEPTDNLAFFIQVHALLALSGRNLSENELSEELSKALETKGWDHKQSLYSYWFTDVEYRNTVEDPKVTAVIISNKFKRESVENLKQLSEQLKGMGEIVLVNNGIPDEEFDPLIEYVDTYVKLNGNSGAYLARNIGAAFSKGEHLLFVDDDGIPDEGMVQAHLDEHENDILVSRGLYYSDNPDDDPYHYHLEGVRCPALTILEGNAMYKADPFYKVGGWGDYILFGHGGKELSYRLLSVDPDKEKQIFTPESRLNHNFIRGLEHQKQKIKKQTRSIFLIWAKHTGFRAEVETWPETFSKETKKVKKTTSRETNMDTLAPVKEVKKTSENTQPVNNQIEKVVFVTPVASSKGAHGLHEVYASETGNVMNKMGLDTKQIAVSDPKLFETLVDVKNSKNQAVFGGLSGYNVWVDTDHYVNGNLYDILGVRVFGHLADQPFAHFMTRRLDRFPKNGVMISTAQSLLDAFRKIYQYDVPTELLDRLPPLITRDGETDPVPFKDRSIDILIPWGLQKFFKNQKPLQEQLKQFGDVALKLGGMIYKQAMEDYETPILDMFEKHSKTVLGAPYTFNKQKTNVDLGWMQVLHLVDFQIRLDRRLRILVELFKTNTDKNIVITASPELAQAFPGLTDDMNIEWVGEMSAQELDKLYADSKVVLSCNPTYPDIVHERVLNAMAMGACVISDHNPMLQKHFGDKDGILFLDNDATNIGEVLSTPEDKLKQVAETGTSIIEDKFTPEDYSARLLEIMNKYNQ